MKILTTSLGTFPVAKPSVEDVFEVAAEMRLQAKKKLLNPVEFVAAMASSLTPQLLEVALRQAVALGSGGGSEPSVATQNDQYVSEDGLAWRLYYHAVKLTPSFTLLTASKIIAADGRWKVSIALEEAISYPEEGEKKEPPTTGTSS